MQGWLLAAGSTIGAVLLLVSCNGGDGEDRTSTVGETPALGDTAVSETPAQGRAAPDIKMIGVRSFDRSELTIAADTEVTIVAENIDGLHSFAIFAGEEYGPGSVDPLART